MGIRLTYLIVTIAWVPTNVWAETAQQLDEARLQTWFDAIGTQRPKETFGEFTVRIATAQLGKAYDDTAIIHAITPEQLHINLDVLECVSLVEYSLSVARCAQRQMQNATCFNEEVEAFRYRLGKMGDYTSRLHYFVEWLTDNTARGRLQDLTPSLGGVPLKRSIHYMTRHKKDFPLLEAAPTYAQLHRTEKRLSRMTYSMIPRDAVASVQAQLKTGDLIAIVTSRPGLLISHTGFVVRDTNDVPRLLHASSHHKRVLITATDIATYMQAKPTREGIMVFRPLPPETRFRPRFQ